MIKWLICLMWGHKTVHKAATGEFSTIDRLTGQPTTGHYYKFDRTPYCTRCGDPVYVEEGEAEYTWTFETAEQSDAFLAFALKLPKERRAIALRDPRQYLTVILNSRNLQRAAQAFHFGWRHCDERRMKDQ